MAVGTGRCQARGPGAYDAEVLTPEILGRTFPDAPEREVLALPEVLPIASRLLGVSTAASDLLVRHPEEVEALQDVAPRDRVAVSCPGACA